MVRKTSHRGVHSGNTLRASNCRFSRRYHNQACIVSRVRPELLQKLQGGESPPTGDKTPQVHNVAVDVALSLNKQARWLLPSALIRQIQTNNIADPELTVSVLERHKLKRPASCVSFHSNKGEMKRIQPRNGRYFGFNFPRPDGKSRRALRREQKKEQQDQGHNNKPTKLIGKTVEVFTHQGKAVRNMELGNSEVRYEVYYPSPAESSISHNPKYIKQDVAFDNSGEHVQSGKPKKQHRGKRRKRMTLKDIGDWELDACDSYPPQTLTTINSSVDREEMPFLDDTREERIRNTAECLLSSLLEKAQQLQNFKSVTKPRRKKKAIAHQGDDKSHIVYFSESQEHSDPEEKPDESSPSTFPPPSLQSHPVSPVPSDSVRILLPKEDVTMASLKDCFGASYFEASCTPRKFVVDVTPSVRELLKKQGIQAKVAEKTEEALSYLICVHDGFYDDEYDVYRVLLNSKLHKGLLTVEISTQGQQDLLRGTVMSLISHTMDFMQGLVTTLKDKSFFPVFVEDDTSKAPRRHLTNHLGSSEIYVPSVKRVFQKGSSISDTVMPSLSDLLQEGPVFCDVCYDDISPLTHGTSSSTSLLTCKHHVCDSCWSQHIHVRLHEGFVRLTCPGYDCQEEVKVGVLLSVAPLDTVEKLLQRQEEVRIGASQTEKWCPNESCGRVISLQSSQSPGDLQSQQDVICACGTHVCFRCLMPAHWPASCKQAEEYRASLSTAVFPDRLAEVHDDYKAEELVKFQRQLQEKKTMLVEGKHCPKCKSFVFKNGGCPQMTCRCGQLFCWYCAKPGYSHPDRLFCVNEQQEKLLTTTIVVHHVEEYADDTEKQQQSSSGSRRQRTSLMERAAEHRQHREKKNKNSQAIAILAKSAATAAAKNKALTQHMMAACRGALPPPVLGSGQGLTAHTSNPQVTVLETVTTFLRSAAHRKQELLEVVEYSLVLLKDLPDSLPRRRALRISEDLGAFCSFTQSIFDVWGSGDSSQTSLQGAVKAVMRLAEIRGWIHAALDTHVVTVRKIRGLHFQKQ